MERLEVTGITVRFGGNIALRDVDFIGEPGKITGLIGPNGAGKTTLFNVITGLLSPSSGEVRIGGRDVTRLAPFRRARHGLARTFQRLELWGQLSVRENVAVAADIYESWSSDTVDEAEIDALITRVGLGEQADERSDSLPTGQARLVEIARALATRPRVLLLDEPASGLDERETTQLGALLRSLRGENMTIVLVEHDMAVVMNVCDRVSVLDFGEIIADGTPAEVRSDDAVLSAYLGTKA